MKKIVSNFFRYILIFLTTVAGCICVISITGIVLASSTGIYDNTLKDCIDNGQKNLSGLYSRYIFENMMEQDAPGCMEDSNLRYLIVKGINPNEDINSKANMEIINNKDNIVYTNMDVNTKEMDEFYYNDYKIYYEEEPVINLPTGIIRSLFDDGGQHPVFDGYDLYEEYVYRLFYQNEIFYFETDNYAFPAKVIEISAAVLNNKDYKLLKREGYISNTNDYVTYDLVTGKDGKLFYRCRWLYNLVLDTSKYKQWLTTVINGISFVPEMIKEGSPGKGIKIFNWEYEKNDYSCKLKNAGAYVENSYGYTSLDYIDIIISYELKSNTHNNVYAILTNVVTMPGKEKNDLFFSQKEFIKFLFDMRYTIIIIAVISAIIFVMLLIFCCYSRYICSDNDIVRGNLLHHIPYLIYFYIAGGLFVLDIFMGISLFPKLIWYASELKLMLVICIISVIWIMTCIFIFIILCLETSCRAGAKIFFKYTVLNSIYKICRKVWRSLKNIYHKASENMSLFIKTFLLLMMANLFILSGFILSGEAGVFFVAAAICAAFDFFVLKIVYQMEVLQEHAKKMAEGNLESQADISKMYWEFKKHGAYLNQIGEGMASAVNERIKSERFKTELITNVSHDIKTPLTSIINYVDLLKKEEIAQPKVQEYLEVLERQSARLKKLIEDLMEASKASTGNIAVELELCDINILLTQTLGEFEEKLNIKELSLVIDQSLENIFIMADNRHIWRIFDNLMNNICKYGQPGTRVYINTEATEKEVTIIFRNTSGYQLNISSDELLERFVRGDSSRHTEGSGLGLSIAQNLAELMGGSLKLHVDGDLFKVMLAFPRVEQ